MPLSRQVGNYARYPTTIAVDMGDAASEDKTKKERG